MNEEMLKRKINTLLLSSRLKYISTEYLLLGEETENGTIPASAYYDNWETFLRLKEPLNELLADSGYKIVEEGVALKEDFDVKKEVWEYIRLMVVALLAPAKRPKDVTADICGRCLDFSSYSEEEEKNLRKFILLFVEIAAQKRRENRWKMCVRGVCISDYSDPLQDIVLKIWNKKLKAGDCVNKIFRKHHKKEAHLANVAEVLPMFRMEGSRLILADDSENMMLYLLAGLMMQRFTVEFYGRRFFKKADFYFLPSE